MEVVTGVNEEEFCDQDGFLPVHCRDIGHIDFDERTSTSDHQGYSGPEYTPSDRFQETLIHLHTIIPNITIPQSDTKSRQPPSHPIPTTMPNLLTFLVLLLTLLPFALPTPFGTALQQQPNPRLQDPATTLAPRPNSAIESPTDASTNLVDWEDLGVI
ncbi:hypothetical protein BC829DRAFT_447956 [Chytridium lagenaria]|nr:hypothetical protein BC829DRAFT_447956 [Chytridium lagenaria]